jgi:hypothetical protein
MKAKLLIATALAALATAAGATDVGVSVSISQPGVYGRIDIGRFPQPQVVVAQPVIVHQPRVVYAQPVQPVYMWVPPGHRKKWHKHCDRYHACGVPVVFVRDEWYQGHVMAHAEHRHHKHHGHKHRHGKDRDDD